MATRPSGELISPDIDPAELFAQAETLFHHDLEILRVVAASSKRVLFIARDPILKRRVALRVQPTAGTAARTWFERETELLAALDHPVLRPIFSAGYRGDWAYRIVKWIEGESLHDAAKRGPRPLPTALNLARDLAGFLEYVHAQRIVIRQMAPTTVMFDLAERNFVSDLRYSSVCLDVAQPRQDPSARAFHAPEIRDGTPGEPTADIYAAGALLYFTATGRAPDEDPDRIVSPRELRPACPRALERVVMRALRRDPTERYLTAAEMTEDLVSDLGEFAGKMPAVAPALGVGDDARSWEKALRRALGDDYELMEELGAGGFGRVYRVRDLQLEREVALKVLHPYLTVDPNVVERFRREAQLAARLYHPGIVSIYDIGGRAGLLWYTMAYVAGTSLSRIVEAYGSRPVDEVVRMLRQALEALEHAHEKGLVHRDLKPENMLIESASGEVRIADFGLALAFKGPDRTGAASSRSGTPEFAAPEQLLGEPVDHRADIYSLALVAFYALTGRAPFEGRTIESLLASHAVGQLPSIATLRRDVPESLIRVLEKAAAPLPNDRYDSAAEFATAVRAAVHPWRTLPQRLVDRLVRGR